MAALNPVMLERLVCPQDLGKLLLIDDILYNPRLHVAYAIDSDGIPNMLIADARVVSDEAHDALMARADASK